jgi:hypothetical protein
MLMVSGVQQEESQITMAINRGDPLEMFCLLKSDETVKFGGSYQTNYEAGSKVFAFTSGGSRFELPIALHPKIRAVSDHRAF